MTTESIPPVVVVVGRPTKNKELITFCKNVIGCLTNNASFPSPNPALAVFMADVTALDNAETSTVGGSMLETSQRNALKRKVIQDLSHERDYVQSVAETLTSNVEAAVQSTGLRLRKASPRTKQLLAAKDGRSSGSVVLVAKAPAAQATYYWEYSLDQKSWTSAPDTMTSTTTIAGLTAGQTYSFRVRTMTRKRSSDFSQPVTHIVR